jgi:hypothetical protein
MIKAMGLKIIVSKVPLNGITSVPNFMKIYQAVQRLLGGGDMQTDRQTDRQIGDLISLLSFLESRLKWKNSSRMVTDLPPL